MDADLIRLILLLLGASLVVGIWWWDRRQRSDEPMAWRDEAPESIDDADEILGLKPREVRDEADAEPERLPEIEIDAAVAPAPAEAEPADEAISEAIAPQPVDAPEAELEKAPQAARAATGTAGQDAPDPLIPAFLLGNEREADIDAAAPPPAELPAAMEPPSEPAWMPDSAGHTDFTLPQGVADAPALDAASEMLEDEPQLPVLELSAEPIDVPARPKKSKKKARKEEQPEADRADPLSIRMEEDQFDLELGFSAVDEQDLQEAAADLPELIVQINVVARRGQPFGGEQILAAMEQVEMQAGEHDIFHRYDNRLRDKQGRFKTLFSLASLVEPGNFPLKKMRDFSTPGLSLFAQLPGPRDGLVVYSDMLYVAERLARLLDANLKDENRSTLTKQTIEHTRSRIAEHKRQITLKLRESNQNSRGRR